MRETKDADFPWWLVILGVTGLWLGYEVWASAIYSQVMGTLVKGIQVTAIIECGGVWFAGSKFGLTWRAKQIAIHKLPEKMGDFAFKGLGSATVAPQEEEDEKDEEVDDDAVFQQPAQPASKPSAVASVMPQAQHTQAHASDDAEEVEDGDDVEPMPAPKKTIIKKKVMVAPKK